MQAGQGEEGSGVIGEEGRAEGGRAGVMPGARAGEEVQRQKVGLA